MQQDRLTDMYLHERIDEQAFDAKKISIEKEKVSLQIELKQSQKNEDFKVTFERAKKTLQTFVDNKNRFHKMPDREKRKVVFSILSNFTLKDRKIVNLQYNPPFHLISKPPQNGDFKLLWA